MPPYSQDNTSSCAPADDTSVLDVEEKPSVDNDCTVAPSLENIDVPQVDLTLATPATRVRSTGPRHVQYQESENREKSEVREVRKARPRRARVQSMPEGSHGAQNFFGSTANGVTEASADNEKTENEAPPRHRRMRSKSLLIKVSEDIEKIEQGNDYEMPPIDTEKIELKPQAKVVKTEESVAQPIAPKATLPPTNTPGKSGTPIVEDTTNCQCIIL